MDSFIKASKNQSDYCGSTVSKASLDLGFTHHFNQGHADDVNLFFLGKGRKIHANMNFGVSVCGLLLRSMVE